ncbi:MAG: LamG domain-containing protein, partial [Planctomycetaceae bacterium]|nr:LamG domain-containing protein [Planctomycetaceae bacterium]
MWSQVDGNGQNDLRLFSEGNTANGTPLFNIGTDNGGASGSVDLFIRQGGWPTVGHIYSTTEPYDGEWHHVVFVQENGERRLYVDGELDDLEIPAKPAATFNASDSINGQGGWQNPVGSAVVFDVEGNQALGFTGADDLNALQLRSLQVPEGGKATVFFRLAALDDAAVDGQVNVLFGLTEKPIRFVGDFNNDAGPIVRLTKEEGFGPITLNARNGVGSDYTIGDNVLDFGGVYNIWIDVENKSNEDGDVYSVYISEDGQAERTVVFENFVSDRNPAGTVDLGKPKTDLMSLLVMSSGLNAGLGNLLFDDLYVSVGKFLDTVPVPSSFASATGPEIVIHSSRVSSDGAGFSFDWNSAVGNIYEVQRQSTLDAPWQTIADAYPDGGATADNTSFTDDGLGASAVYRVAQLAVPPLFFDDFESGAKGWDTSDLGESGTLWELGKPTNGPGEAHSPTHAYGTGLAKDYDDYTDVYLVSPVIDLTGKDNARLEFWS